jgi:hypothetical protein
MAVYVQNAGALGGVSGALPVEVHGAPNDVRPAVSTVLQALLVFLAEHSMLACFEVSGRAELVALHGDCSCLSTLGAPCMSVVAFLR